MSAIEGFQLSPLQRYLWSLGWSAAHESYGAGACVLIQGTLDEAGLLGALHSVVRRHEVLRTTFHRPSSLTVPLQVIGSESVAWERTNGVDPASAAAHGSEAKMLERLFEAELRRPFDLDRGPSLRASLVDLGTNRHALFLSAPTLCADTLGLDAQSLFPA